MLLETVRSWIGNGYRPGLAERVLLAPPEPASLVPEPDLAAELEAGPWPEARVALNDQLWGQGFLFPGGEDEALKLARPLGLTTAASLLVVGAGSGGPPRSIAARFGVWVTGFEADPSLAAIAAERCARARLGGRAQMEMWYPARPAFPRRSFHHGVAFEPLRQGGGAEPILAALAGALRPAGQLMIVETVADAPLDGTDPTVAAWCRLEQRTAELPTEAGVTRMLGRLGFDVRVAEDVTGPHTRRAMLGWKRKLATLRHRPPPTEAALLVAEAELWLLRLKLMREGRMRLVRWHAISTVRADSTVRAESAPPHDRVALAQIDSGAPRR